MAVEGSEHRRLGLLVVRLEETHHARKEHDRRIPVCTQGQAQRAGCLAELALGELQVAVEPTFLGERPQVVLVVLAGAPADGAEVAPDRDRDRLGRGPPGPGRR